MRIKLVEFPFAIGSYGARLMAHLIGCTSVSMDLLYAGCADVVGISVHFPRQLIYLQDIFRNLKISPWRIKRKESDPLIIFGGYGIANPEPVSDIADVVCVGDGEYFADVLREAIEKSLTKQEVFSQLKETPGAYFPLEDDGPRDSWLRKDPVEVRIKAAAIEELRDVTTIMTRSGSSDSSPTLEIARGCKHKCPYCAIGWTKNYIERSEESVKNALERSPHESVKGKYRLFAADLVGVDWFHSSEFVNSTTGDATVQAVLNREDSLKNVVEPILGIEGMSERLRSFVWKPVKNDDLLRLCEVLKEQGRKKMVWFMMHSFPSEGAVDREEFSWLMKRLPDYANIEFRFTPFQKTPFTPLSYLRSDFNQDSKDYTDWLKRKFRTKAVRTTHSRKKAKKHMIDTVLACGSRGLGKILVHMGRTILSRTQESLVEMFRTLGCDYYEIRDEWPESSYLPWGYVTFDTWGRMTPDNGASLLRKKLKKTGHSLR